MSEIAELERRITAALDRIGAGLERLDAAAAATDTPPAEDVPPDTGEADSLREALAAEKEANTQLEERIKALHSQQETRVKELEEQVGDLKSGAREAGAQLQQLRKTNQQLQISLQSLREAGADSTTEPHLINQAMMSELEGLRSIRDADRAEMDAILGSLKPLLEEETNA